jgi:biotin-dependent carboxylase-like uncharacterized protein
MIVVLKPGFLDLVMDLGRPGYRAQGVPAGGAADAAALVRVNRLVGNADGAAGLEMTLHGPLLTLPLGASVALGGAGMAASLDGKPMQPDRRYEARPGARLEFGIAASGMRAYLAAGGGIDVPPVLGSRATFLPGGWGGAGGRALRAGDRLRLGAAPRGSGQRLPRIEVRDEGVLRVLPGPQIGAFADVALARFLQEAFRVHPDSNRVGIRLQGPALHCRHGEMASQAVLPGTVQVPPTGQPIILGWDGPVTGGYPVIAGVIAADLPRLAQLRPGDEIVFRMVERAEALAACAGERTWPA